jgi:hypothetical protein
MKVTLDLSKLMEEGKLTPAEADRLRALAAQDTGAFAINILIAFGIVAVSGGAVALVPTPLTALLIGLAVFAAGLAFTLLGKERWSLLGQICLVIGALMFCGGVLAIGKGSLAAMLIVTAALTGAAIVARSSLLMAAAGTCARRLSRRPHRLLARDIYARHLRAAGHDRTVRSPCARDVLPLEVAPSRLRTIGVDRGADVRVHGQFRLLDRLALGRLFTAHPLAVARPSTRSDRLGNSAFRLCHWLGGCAACNRYLGRSGESAMGGQCRRGVRGHSFLHAMVREARIGPDVCPCWRPHNARLRNRTVDVQ